MLLVVALGARRAATRGRARAVRRVVARPGARPPASAAREAAGPSAAPRASAPRVGIATIRDVPGTRRRGASSRASTPARASASPTTRGVRPRPVPAAEMTDGPSTTPPRPSGPGGVCVWRGVALGGAGVLLAASTAVWPTKIVAVRVPEVGDFTKGYEQLDLGLGTSGRLHLGRCAARRVLRARPGAPARAPRRRPRCSPRRGCVARLVVAGRRGELARGRDRAGARDGRGVRGASGCRSTTGRSGCSPGSSS